MHGDIFAMYCSLTLDRDYFAYLTILTHPGTANWDGSAGVARLFFCCWHNNKRCHPGVLISMCLATIGQTR